MIAWFDANQGFVMAILTIAYVIATIALVLLSRRQLAHSIRLESSRLRPFLVFDIIFKHHCAHALLRNTGLTPAFDVHVTVSPPITRSGQNPNREIAITSSPITYMSPGREFCEFIDSSPQFFARYPNPEFRSTITYRDGAGTRYTDEVALDLGFIGKIEYIGEPDHARELEGIRKALESLAKARAI